MDTEERLVEEGMTTLAPLPCPCCGYKKITMWPMKDYESPLCESCGLTVCENVAGTGTRTHLSVWNRRAISPEIAGALKEAEKWLKWCVECSEAEGYTRPSAHPDQLRGMRAALARIEGVK